MENNPITLKIDFEKTAAVSQKIAESKQWEIEWKKWPRPETILWWHNRLVHKMEPDRLFFLMMKKILLQSRYEEEIIYNSIMKKFGTINKGKKNWQT